ncbi:hypothetical protein Enr10x_33920 [Gimesia panareensis]|uniref:Uncharacterized protein n=1 Tax=Gimesia panareensis TaxID=2527978 RepID=A0A517Q8U7_9PLAN|nr:hypothetical protein [Gimesia panareensis]QDT28053.1 hypothetical protein Enr10x_33920 [Gimesia panareensis]
MFQRTKLWGIIILLVGLWVIQQRGLYAQSPGVEALGGRLNRDSFQLSREIRTRFRGIRGQRVFFSKALEIHQMADDIQRMIILKAPVQGMDQALVDLELLVSDLEQSLKSARLPVLTSPVIKPTGPNGYVFYGGNGYPDPCFRCNGFPYQMIPEQSLQEVFGTLQEMQTSIRKLQAHYAPPVTAPEKRIFPVPGAGRDTGLPPAFPSNRPRPVQPGRDSGWQPARKTAPVFPPAPKQQTSPPAVKGPEFLPPLPSPE